ncbi:pyrroloquinoline quinone biosynthesis protein PqqB [Telmatospirillum siberiense]|uniref:Coenzyme PQQ synthesis protein B n=1 Tax=Telmatospirillum siberiense TaxID=382514 RepID=A0A2N3PPZ4_9PROT|nr:pyrroloquinoline quinone biosynthesis protein PqqB [Telmatospirillum siberiense]PKU22475.1 pyrroloquinoline quinone biosynthesis protein PqqB [Telmatospirillum siberiense]
MLHILILGVAAGGGVPQWNCNCEICRRARAKDPMISSSTQASLAVSGDDENWFVINASPDLRQQIIDNPRLHPRRGLRDSPLAGVILTNGDIDAIAGLLTLREGSPFSIYAHDRVLAVLRENSIFNVLAEDRVARHAIEPDAPFIPRHPDGRPSALEITAFTVPGKVPLYLETEENHRPGGLENGDTLGLHIRHRTSGAHFFVLTACARMTPALARRITGAPLVFFDGTLWRDDEMIHLGLGEKTGLRMGHLSMSGEEGSIAALRSLDVRRKIYLHINNSNPAWVADAPERRQLRQSGWEILDDGTEITL